MAPRPRASVPREPSPCPRDRGTPGPQALELGHHGLLNGQGSQVSVRSFHELLAYLLLIKGP